MAEQREIEFVFEPQPEGGYYVYAPELPGLHTQGEDLDDATDNARGGARVVYPGAARGGSTDRQRRGSSQAPDLCVSERLPAISGAQLIRALDQQSGKRYGRAAAMCVSSIPIARSFSSCHCTAS